MKQVHNGMKMKLNHGRNGENCELVFATNEELYWSTEKRKYNVLDF